MDQAIQMALVVRPTTHANVQILSSRPNHSSSLFIHQDTGDRADAREPKPAKLKTPSDPVPVPRLPNSDILSNNLYNKKSACHIT